MNQEREIRAIETGWLLMLPVVICSPSLCCQLAPGPSPSPLLFPLATPTGLGAPFPIAAAGCRKSFSPWGLQTCWGRFPPSSLLASDPGAPELARVYFKFPSKLSLHLLEAGKLSACLSLAFPAEVLVASFCAVRFSLAAGIYCNTVIKWELVGTLLSCRNISRECTAPHAHLACSPSCKYKGEELKDSDCLRAQQNYELLGAAGFRLIQAPSLVEAVLLPAPRGDAHVPRPKAALCIWKRTQKVIWVFREEHSPCLPPG